MRITTLAQGAINFIAQFVRIVFKILASHLCNQTKLFLNNVKIKKAKIIYKNKELAPGIRQYVFEHIQNLDQILADLEQEKFTIVRTKSQFC